ncbi:hypothetical protein Ddc_08501 [Ditylenchus destructor]|nr:hypothetical protein Ddc_08501 [Ditylenchus destructor]
MEVCVGLLGKEGHTDGEKRTVWRNNLSHCSQQSPAVNRNGRWMKINKNHQLRQRWTHTDMRTRVRPPLVAAMRMKSIYEERQERGC